MTIGTRSDPVRLTISPASAPMTNIAPTTGIGEAMKSEPRWASPKAAAWTRMAPAG